MDSKAFWNKKHLEYASKNWIDKPTIFSQLSIKYFPKKGKLLELGCGHGQDSRYFAKKGFKVTATDFSESALKFLKEKSEKEKLTITVKKIDLSKKLTLSKETFDIVYSHLALHYFDHVITKKLFSEIARVLKKDGIFAALFNSTTDPEIGDFEMIEKDYYQEPGKILKRYFNPKSLEEFIPQDIEVLLLDANGETFKDEIKTLIRFIGKKI